MGLANNKLKDFGDKAFELLQFYRDNPVIAAEDLLGVELAPAQRLLFEDMWFKPYVLVTASRGSGKTFLLSVISTLYAMLNAGVRVLLMSPSFRQCVVGSTHVLYESNFIKVSDLFDKPNSLKTYCGSFQCTDFFKNEKSATIRIRTENGFLLEGAVGHKVLVDYSILKYQELKELYIGDAVLVFCGGFQSYSKRNENYLKYLYETCSDTTSGNIVFKFNNSDGVDLAQLYLLDYNVFTKKIENTLEVDIKDSVSVNSLNNIVNGVSISKRFENRWIKEKIIQKFFGFDNTYDFTIEKVHSYLSNGFVSHNSKMIFEEVDKRFTNSPILREACEKRPIISSDRCYLNFRGVDDKPGSSVEAYPLGTDGAKIRGLRGHCILADEFAQIPEEIFDLVIRPMGATTSSPMENVKKIKYLKEKLLKGVITKEEFELEKSGLSSNKIICTSSAYYQFNHMFRRIKSYEEEIAKGSDKYATHAITYEDMPEGFLDTSNIEEAKVSMSRAEFDMEYRAIWKADSDGAFKASLIEQSTSREKTVSLQGEVGKKYVIGVDPARSSDAFAVVVIEVGNPSAVVAAYQATGKKFPQMAQFIHDISDKFEAALICMDAGSGGGGVAIKDLLANEQFFGKRTIIDMDDEEYKNISGRKILRMFNPNPNSISEINFNSLNILEQGLLKFPKRPVDFDEEKEKIYEDIKVMITQVVSVVITETKSGVAHFDIPATGKGKRKKDLYSAFILAASGLYSIINNKKEEDNSVVNNCGIVVPRRNILAPSIMNATNYYGRR